MTMKMSQRTPTTPQCGEPRIQKYFIKINDLRMMEMIKTRNIATKKKFFFTGNGFYKTVQVLILKTHTPIKIIVNIDTIPSNLEADTTLLFTIVLFSFLPQSFFAICVDK